MAKNSKEGQVEIAPLRSLDDFLLESARFQIPNYKDLEKWGNRVTSNLLYYQTNYFLLAILIIICVGWVFIPEIYFTSLNQLFCFIVDMKENKVLNVMKLFNFQVCYIQSKWLADSWLWWWFLEYLFISPMKELLLHNLKKTTLLFPYFWY